MSKQYTLIQKLKIQKNIWPSTRQQGLIFKQTKEY